MLFLWVSRLLLIAGSLLVAAGTAYGGTVSYMMWRESVSPSTQQMLVLKDGRRIPLQQPAQQSTMSNGISTGSLPPLAPTMSAPLYSPSSPEDLTGSSQIARE